MKQSIVAATLLLWLAFSSAEPPAECKCPNTTGTLTVQECLPDGTGCTIAIKVTGPPDTCVAEFPYCVLCVRRTAGKEREVAWTVDSTKGKFQNRSGLTITPPGTDFILGKEELQQKTWIATTDKSPSQRTTSAQVYPKTAGGGYGLQTCGAIPAYIINTETP